METPGIHQLPEPNPVTRERHRHQVLWQVFFPIGLTVLVILILAVLVTLTSTEQVMRLSDISIIFLILPTAIVGLLFLALFSGIVYLLARGIRLLPPYARLAQIYLDRLTAAIKQAADRAADPFVVIQSTVAGVQGVFRKPGSNGADSTEQTRTTR